MRRFAASESWVNRPTDCWCPVCGASPGFMCTEQLLTAWRPVSAHLLSKEELGFAITLPSPAPLR